MIRLPSGLVQTILVTPTIGAWFFENTPCRTVKGSKTPATGATPSRISKQLNLVGEGSHEPEGYLK